MLLFFSSLTTAFSSQAQATQKVVVPQAFGLGREEYMVLQAAPETKQGAYWQYAGKKGTTLVTTGFYAAGQKDSVWTTYYERGKVLQARGQYARDQKRGVWEYFSEKDALQLKFDHGTGQTLFSLPAQRPSQLVCRPMPGAGALTTDPQYALGSDALSAKIGMTTRYPAVALRNNVMGQVRVAFVIDSTGAASNFLVVHGIGSGCDEEALRVVKLLPSNWIPAYTNGRPVAAACEVPVTFSIK
ncbi:energy transducer TonB [Hymenobacter lapidiphilus]|uniref:Energy transducer TonB n=1 Tax=Hymenobacter lapidiphilus TaxID=2608003 RepID=A0A7Y7PLV6_9BACT|nr:energy transducer TonB [Hymenobacter lapidiphilus]NVO30191.1 energy transducer TonB [Hymenobacter lapidiphilus]